MMHVGCENGINATTNLPISFQNFAKYTYFLLFCFTESLNQTVIATEQPLAVALYDVVLA